MIRKCSKIYFAANKRCLRAAFRFPAKNRKVTKLAEIRARAKAALH